ncbi:MAG: MmgE/PrpD family protein, partial [Pseudomonadota bacterium]
FKPYPVCRWAQAPVEAVLSVRPRLDGPVEEVVVETFAESIRLAVTTPRTIEEAQYSTAFPVAVALARGRLTATDLSGPALGDAEIRRLAGLIRFVRSAEADALFPETRIARVRVRAGGGVVESDWCRPRWDADAPPGEADLVAKFAALTAALPTDRRAAILDVLRAPARMGDLRRAVTATVAAPALGSRP